MAKYTVIYQSKGNEMPYSLYCEPHPGVSLETALKSWDIKEEEIQFIFEGWPRRVSLSYWKEDIKDCEFRPF